MCGSRVRSQFWNDSILLEFYCPWNVNLAELPAKFYSTGFQQESQGEGKDLMDFLRYGGAQTRHLCANTCHIIVTWPESAKIK